MAFELVARVMLKWRPLLVFLLLNTAGRMVGLYIRYQADTPGVRLYGSMVSIAIGIYCLMQIWRLITRDREGDEKWPALWA